MLELKTLTFYFFQFYYSTFFGIYQRYIENHADESLLKYATSFDGISAILFFTLGAFFLFLSNHFMNLSSFTLFSIFTYTVLRVYSNIVNPLAQVVDIPIRKFIPENVVVVFGPDEKHAIGYIVFSLTIALIALMFMQFSRYILILGLLLTSFIFTNKLFTNSQSNVYEFSILHIVLTIGLTIIAYMLIMYLKDIFFIGLFSFVGSAMFLVIISMIFSYPQKFTDYYLSIFGPNFFALFSSNKQKNGDKETETKEEESNSLFYINILIHLTTAGLGYLFQSSVFKNSK